MVFVACSGFPVPVSRYWQDFMSVEISDTELGIPGEGTLSRWAREAPKGFAFTVLAPKEIAASGFRRTNENKLHLAAIASVAERLAARAVVFLAPEEFKHAKAARAAVKSFLGVIPKDFPTPVLDLPAWKPKDVAQAIGDRPAAIAYDPLSESSPATSDLDYMRLPGPAGFRSRYDDESLAKIAERCLQADADNGFCVFRNIDRHANACALRKLLDQ